MREIKAVQVEVDEILQEFNNCENGDNPDDREIEIQNFEVFNNYTEDYQPEYMDYESNDYSTY
jgi:hypothetical protein